jgi:hypothetical protein
MRLATLVGLALLMPMAASWTPSRPGRSVSKTTRVVRSNNKKSSQKAVSIPSATTNVNARFQQQLHHVWKDEVKQMLYGKTEKRSTISLDSFESALEVEWAELLDMNRENARALLESKKPHTPKKSVAESVALVEPIVSQYMTPSSTEIVSVAVAGVTTFLKAVGFVLTESMSSVMAMGDIDKTDGRLSKISRAGQGWLKLGKDLMDSSLPIVLKGLRNKALNDPTGTPSGTRPVTSSSDTRRAASLASFRPASLDASSRSFPSHVYTSSATRPVSSLGTRPVNSLGTRPVQNAARPTISLSPDEASQVWGYECDRRNNGYPSGIDYMRGHWRTLQLVAVELLEDVRSYTAMATEETIQGITQACDETIHAVTKLQTSVLKPPNSLRIKAPQKHFFASTKTGPVIGSKVSIDPKVLYFVDPPCLKEDHPSI